jgi:hypothetical protein
MFGCDTDLITISCELGTVLYDIRLCINIDLRKRFHFFAELFNECQLHIRIFDNLDSDRFTVIFSFVYHAKCSFAEFFRTTNIQVAGHDEKTLADIERQIFARTFV